MINSRKVTTHIRNAHRGPLISIFGEFSGFNSNFPLTLNFTLFPISQYKPLWAPERGFVKRGLVPSFRHQPGPQGFNHFPREKPWGKVVQI